MSKEYINRQALPGPRDADGAFRELSGRPIFWESKNGLTHWCMGADVHRDVRLIWTACLIDVPANKAFLPGDRDIVTCGTCMRVAIMEEEDARQKRADQGQFGVGA